MEETHISDNEILDWLQEVKDPEIPVISLVDLGVITGLNWKGDALTVTMTPTFVGCPAMDYMVNDVKEVLAKRGLNDVAVDLNFDEPWNSNKITDAGRKALKDFGLAPPPKHNYIVDIDILNKATCPVCNSDDTELKSPFGPTACRSIHYCHSCLETFEQFKPL